MSGIRQILDAKQLPEALVPVWTMNEPNEEVNLYSGDMTFAQSDDVFSGEGRIFLRWYPRCELAFELTADNITPMKPALDRIRLTIPDGDQFAESEAEIQKVTNIIGPNRAIAGNAEGFSFGKNNSLSRLLFHLPNFPDLRAKPIARHETCSVWLGRHTLESDEWRILLDDIEDRGFRKRLKSECGSGFTHVGMVERRNNSEFSATDADDLLDCLFWFFSFCKSHWTGPLLLVGFDKSGAECYRRFTSTRVTPERGRRHWLDHFGERSLELLYPGFRQKWLDPEWKDVLITCVYWYVDACLPGRGAEGAIIILCAIFEALSWMEFVETGVQTSGDHRNTSAAAKLRQLLAHYHIDSALPKDLEFLRADAARLGKHIADGPDSVFLLRNAYVHPTKEKRRIISGTPSATEFVLLLAQHYASLCLLRLFDYQGSYVDYWCNATFEGAAGCRVPWQ